MQKPDAVTISRLRGTVKNLLEIAPPAPLGWPQERVRQWEDACKDAEALLDAPEKTP